MYQQQVRLFCRQFSLRIPVGVVSRRVVGTAAATLCAARCVYMKSISCDSITASHPRIQLTDATLHDSVLASTESAIIISPKRESIVDRAFRWLNFLSNFVKSIVRSLELGLIFAPVIITSPLLMFKREDYHTIWWSVLKCSVKSAGACFTKLAQWISTRPDLFPLRLCTELETLQTNAYIHPWSETERILKLAFGSDVLSRLHISESSVFVGSGSAAQVYAGEYDGKPVAVKVLHPRVRSSIDADLSIMRFVVTLVETIPGVSAFSLSEVVEEFATLLLQQLDLRMEAEALRHLRKNFVYSEWSDVVSFPEPIEALVTANTLVETYILGDPISKYTNSPQPIKTKLAHICLNVLLKMVFEDNFVHGDLHGGNILVKEDNSGRNNDSIKYKLGIIDAGIAHSMSAEDRVNFVSVFFAFIRKDGHELGKLMIEKSRNPSKCIDITKFSSEMSKLVDDLNATGIDTEHVSVGQLMKRVFSLCYMHQVKLESRYVSFIISVSIMEGLVRQLDPSIDVLDMAKPYIRRAAALEFKNAIGRGILNNS